MSKIKQSLIRRRKKRTESLDDSDIRREKDSKVTRTSSFVSREVLLHHAVTSSNFASFSKILESEDVDINCMRPPGITPLHMACVAGNMKFVVTLVEKGADIELKTTLGLSPLQLAVLFGHYDVAEYMIAQGSDPNDIKDGVQSDNFQQNVGEKKTQW